MVSSKKNPCRPCVHRCPITPHPNGPLKVRIDHAIGKDPKVIKSLYCRYFSSWRTRSQNRPCSGSQCVQRGRCLGGVFESIFIILQMCCQRFEFGFSFFLCIFWSFQVSCLEQLCSWQKMLKKRLARHQIRKHLLWSPILMLTKPKQPPVGGSCHCLECFLSSRP